MADEMKNLKKKKLSTPNYYYSLAPLFLYVYSWSPQRPNKLDIDNRGLQHLAFRIAVLGIFLFLHKAVFYCVFYLYELICALVQLKVSPTTDFYAPTELQCTLVAS